MRSNERQKHFFLHSVGLRESTTLVATRTSPFILVFLLAIFKNVWMRYEPEEREEEREEPTDGFPAETVRLKSQRSHFTLTALPCISADTSVLTHVATHQPISYLIGTYTRPIFICHEYDAEQ